MRRLTLILCAVGFSASLVYSQSFQKPDADQTLEKLALLSDVKALAVEIPKLDGPLARAVASAGVADAAWTLDRSWSRKTLRDAYRLTYPTDEEKSKFPPTVQGTPPRPPTLIDRSRSDVRQRILNIARRDSAFADQLIRDSAEHVTKDDQQMMYAQLAQLALADGNNDVASRAIEQSMGVDPIQITFVTLVNDLAVKDRAAADKLVLQCMASVFQLAGQNVNINRADLTLTWLVFPNSTFPDPNKRIPDPGPTVMKAYVSYMLDYLAAQEQRRPGSLVRARSQLLRTWVPLNAHVPELRERFLQLESLSRTPGMDASLPTMSYEEADKTNFRKADNEAFNSDDPSDVSIRSMISRHEFDTARKLIDKLPDGARKAALTEDVNTKEAISLAMKGDLLQAQALAERLTTTGSIMLAYPVLVQQFTGNKDQATTSAVVHQAIRQIKNAKAKLMGTQSTPSFGVPPSFAASIGTIDPVLLTLGRLARAITPLNSLLACDVIDEMVVTANRSQMDTKLGRIGFDSDVFIVLAAKDEIRARSAAENLKDPLRRIVALASIYKWKAKRFEKEPTSLTAQ